MRLVIRGGSDAIHVVARLKAENVPVILTSTMAAPDREYEGYDGAYTMPARLHAAGVKFAIAGGSGAGPDHDGTSAVQTHMTNSRLTDHEVLETRLPVRLERFAIRRDSGGKGKHEGGDGVVRDVRFLEPMRANMLANRRRVAPRGLAGGSDALPGRNWVERVDGGIEELTATDAAEMQVVDRFVNETPSGGGYGAVE